MRATRFIHRISMLLLMLFFVGSAMLRPAPSQAVSTESEGLVVPGDGATQVFFGDAVAVDGDYMAIGAPYETVGSLSSAGAVYLYKRDAQAPSGWTELKKLTAPTPISQAFFGQALALQGDVLVIGSHYEHVASSGAYGAAYVYLRDQGAPDAWAFAHRFEESSAGALAEFGVSIAIDGDVLAIGALGARSHRGAAYLYSRSAAWAKIKELPEAPLVPGDEDAINGFQFGEAVALEDDTLLVGAPRTTLQIGDPLLFPPISQAGAVFVFQRNTGGPNAWGQVKRLIAENPTDNANFGNALDIDAGRLIVGARFENLVVNDQIQEYSRGAAYIFERDNGATNAWGHVASLHATDAGSFDYFGSDVGILGDQAWVGSPYSDGAGFNNQGAVYAYERNQGGANSWGAAPIIGASDGLPSEAFGSALAVSANELVVGAPARDESGTYVFDASDLSAQMPYHIYLPLGVDEWYPPTGLLQNNSTVESANGAILGAVEGTLAAPVEATIQSVPAPTQPFPIQVTTHGDYYVVGGQDYVIAPADKPFLIGLPVPDGVDSTKLAVMALMTGDFVSEAEGGPLAWQSIPGRYDAASKLFVITMRTLLPGGVKLVLYSHPNNAPLPVLSVASQLQQALPVSYNVSCDASVITTTACTPANLQLLKAELESAHSLFVGSHGFKPPALVHAIGAFIGSNKQPTLSDTYYGVLLGTNPCIGSSGDLIAGEYRWTGMQLLVCMDDPGNVDAVRSIVRHELFHAIQASYPQVAADYLGPKRYPKTLWLMEGTAAAAERSSYIMLRSNDFGLHSVTSPLTNTLNVEEYSAQDFWVYTGLELGESIAYLQPIFDQGATPLHVDRALTLKNAYWSWAKNHALEHHERLDGALDAAACALETKVVPTTINMSYPAKRSTQGSLEPLASAVVKITFTSGRGFVSIMADNDGNSDDLVYKVYKADEAGCEAVPDGQRTLSNVKANDVYYVLLSNISIDTDFRFVVQINAE